MNRRTTLACALTLALAAAPVSATVATAGPVHYTPGASGIGDPYVPNEGNGGYQVRKYAIDLRFDPHTNRLKATTVIRATAKQNLSRMDFDLFGLKVTSIKVNGQQASFHREPRELVVRPAHGINNGDGFVVKVNYQGKPRTLNDPDLGLSGWFNTHDGAIVAGEPEAGMFWFPVNEHPSDKAYVKVTATVPKGLMVVSNGLPSGPPSTSQGWTTFDWSSAHPMASYLATVSIGKFRTYATKTDSGTPVLNYIDRTFPRKVDRSLNKADEIINFFEPYIGRYPFEAAGGIADDHLSYYALENQTRPTYDKATVGWHGLTGTVAHELAHQWFGDSVALHRWSDIWLNEGFASYMEWMWDAHDGGPSVNKQFGDNYARDASSSFWTLEVTDPGYAHLFDAPIYARGAMALHALRLKIGSHDFFKTLKNVGA